jgi:integrase
MAKSTAKLKRANGEGSIYQTGRGGWRAALVYTDPDGNRRRRTVSGKTQADVRRSLATLRADLDRGLTPPERMTVGEFLARWLEASRQRIRHSTWRGYESCVRVYIVPALGRIELGKLQPSDVERLTAKMTASGLSPRTAALTRVVLRRALADAERDGLVHRNAARLARPPHVPSRSLEAGRDYFGPDDLRRLQSAAKVHPMGPLVTVAATTGLRLGELLGLAWSDIDSERRTLTVRRSLARAPEGWALAEPKTKRSRRTIDLPAATLAAFERQRELQCAARDAAEGAWQDVDGLAFTDAVGRPLRGSWVNHTYHDMLRAAELPSIPFHGLRHTAATALLAAGVPLVVVSRYLGHATITVTADRYAGVTPDLGRSTADAMDRALAGGAS